MSEKAKNLVELLAAILARLLEEKRNAQHVQEQ
jgi:hypothetical protein